jgi:hypothetical protein
MLQNARECLSQRQVAAKHLLDKKFGRVVWDKDIMLVSHTLLAFSH